MLQKLQQAGIIPMTLPETSKQCDVDRLSSVYQMSSLLAELSPHNSPYMAVVCTLSELPVPMMLDVHQASPAPMATWEAIRSTMDNAIDKSQEQARQAPLMSFISKFESQSWLDVMGPNALSACGSVASNHTVVAGDSSHADFSSSVRADILSSVAQSAAGFTEPATPELSVPLLCSISPEQDFMARIFREAQSPEAPEYLQGSDAQCSVMGSSKATYHSLVAQELALQDNVCTLPVVLLDDTSDGHDEAESKEEVWQQCMADCRFRQQRFAHLELYLDWSLSNDSFPCPGTLQNFKHQLHKQLQPAILRPVDADSALSDSATRAAIISSIADDAPIVRGMPFHAVQHPEQLPRAVKDRLQKRPLYQQQAGRLAVTTQAKCQTAAGVTSQSARVIPILSVAGNHPSRDSVSRITADRLSGSVMAEQPPLQGAPSAKASVDAQGTGVFHNQSKLTRPANSKQPAASAGNDMAFFLGLQHRATGLTPAAVVPLPNQPGAIDLCNDDGCVEDDEEAEEEMAKKLPDVQYVTLQLPVRLQMLLSRMKEEHGTLIKETDGINTEVGYAPVQLYAVLQALSYSPLASAVTSTRQPSRRWHTKSILLLLLQLCGHLIADHMHV